MGFRDDVVKGGATTQWLCAITTLIIPSKVDLITSTAPGDQPGFINVMLFH
jgi:hypothetical protein